MFVKTRNEEDAYQMTFVDRLGTTETITTAEVAVDYATVDLWNETNGLVSSPSVVEDGKTIQFTLGATNDPVGRYRIRCVVTTSANRKLENYVDLRIL